MKNTFDNYPPKNSPELVHEYKSLEIDYALCNGVAFLTPTTTPTSEAALKSSNVGQTTYHAPFTLYPSPFPRKLFNLAYKLGPVFGALYHAVANDAAFIHRVFAHVSESDDFTKKLLEIYNKCHYRDGQGPLQKITLGLHRSDYMLNDAPNASEMTIKQVEYNTISVSFAGLTNYVSKMHKFMAKRTNCFNTANQPMQTLFPENLPENKCGDSLADGLASAWKLYGNPNAYVLFIVQPHERNVFDQRMIEFHLFEQYNGIKALRRTLAEVANTASTDPETGALLITQPSGERTEIAVVYFRGGYTPRDYTDSNTSPEWEARELIESSLAVKCPNIAHHLAGAKIVQQVLSLPGEIERYIPDKAQCDLIRSSFTKLYPLDGSPEGSKAYEMVLKTNGANLVLKPQREGGGNNFYEEQIVPYLAKLSAQERSAYILMDLIRPPLLTNALVKADHVVEAQVINELGVYEVWLSEGSVVHLNYAGGHNFRTKVSTEHEGGVATGVAVLDSPILIN